MVEGLWYYWFALIYKIAVELLENAWDELCSFSWGWILTAAAQNLTLELPWVGTKEHLKVCWELRLVLKLAKLALLPGSGPPKGRDDVI